MSTCVTAARLATQLDPCAESQLLLVKCLAVTDNAEMLVQQLEVKLFLLLCRQPLLRFNHLQM